MISLLSTKSLPTTEVVAFAQAGFKVTAVDFINVETVEVLSPFSPADYAIFTSQNAVRALSAHPKEMDLAPKRAFCVGEKTKALLMQKGWSVIASFDYAKELAQELITHYSGASFVFFCGDKRLDTLPNALNSKKITFEEVLTYRTLLTPQKVNESFAGILFFSPSAVESYLKIHSFREEKLLCIGTTTQKALPKGVESYVAPSPSMEGIRELCQQLFY